MSEITIRQAVRITSSKFLKDASIARKTKSKM